VIEDAEHDGRRLFLHAKNNLGPVPQGLAFRLEQCLLDNSIVASRVLWDTALVTITASEALAADAVGSEARTAVEATVDWLRELLADGPLPARQVRSEGDAAGYSWATIRRAKDAAGIEAFRDGGAADQGRWLWRLPAGESLRCSPNAYDAQDKDVSTLGEFEHLSADEPTCAPVGNGKSAASPSALGVCHDPPDPCRAAHHC
jgi:putative DNA primase/helicase